jgi:hypothetical protein
MNDDWNRGYEKGRDDYCCNGNCNQGRNCPLRKVELTDEEIVNLYKETEAENGGIREFARAILRKAQEK